MSKFENDKVIPRYMAIAVVLTIIGLAVIGKAFYIMTADWPSSARPSIS